MTAYNFKNRFVEMITDGRKSHTVRRRRKYPIKVGATLQLYTGMRTKNCQLIARAKCIKITSIQIIRGVGVRLDGNLLSDEDTHSFAKADGFFDAWEMFDFFDQYPYEVVSGEFEVIYWEKVEQ